MKPTNAPPPGWKYVLVPIDPGCLACENAVCDTCAPQGYPGMAASSDRVRREAERLNCDMRKAFGEPPRLRGDDPMLMALRRLLAGVGTDADYWRLLQLLSEREPPR